jgi:hypothetical protein
MQKYYSRINKNYVEIQHFDIGKIWRIDIKLENLDKFF